MIYRFLITVIAVMIAGNLRASDKQNPIQEVSTLFELCVKHIYIAKSDAQYPLGNIGVGVASSDKRLCTKVLRHILFHDGLSADIATVEQLIQGGAELYPMLSLQGLIRNADTDSQNHECPIDLINPGVSMTEQQYKFMDMLQKYGLNFNTPQAKKLVFRAIKNNNQDFVRYAGTHGFNIHEYLKSALLRADTPVFNYICKQLCFKGCQDNCDKIHQSDNSVYRDIAKGACSIVNSPFFQAYAFRHAIKQKLVLDLMKNGSGVTHNLLAAGIIKDGSFFAIYKPNALEHDWIIKRGPENGTPVKAHACKVGDEISYTFVCNEYILTLPNPSSGIASTLRRKKVAFDTLHPKEQQKLLRCGPAQFRALTSEDMGLEVFYQD